VGRLFTTGWELGNDPNTDIPWDADTWSSVTVAGLDSVTTQKRSPGARSLYVSTSSRYTDSTWAGMTFSALDEFWLRFAYRFQPTVTTYLDYTNSILQWVDDGGDEVGSLRLNGQSLLFSLFAGATLLGTEPEPRSLTTFRWNLIELHWKTHASTGVAELKFNGNMKLQLTGQNTAVAGEGQIREIRFGIIKNVSYIGAQGYNFWDDCAADDDGWVGDGRVVLLQPNGDGAHSEFTGSDGNQVNNYQLVDEAVPSAADYVEGTSEGLIDTYSMEDTGDAGIPSGSEILDVEVLAVASTLDVGYNALSGVVRVGGTDYNKPEQQLIGDYKLHRFKFPTNPATSIAWTPSELDSAEAGIQAETTATTVPPTTTAP